jgi:hypothetical protein
MPRCLVAFFLVASLPRCLFSRCLVALLPCCLVASLPRCLFLLLAFFPYLCPPKFFTLTFVFRLSRHNGVLKRNRVQITGCRATVCCSEWSQPHMLHITPLYPPQGMGRLCSNTTSQDTCLKTETNAFAVKSSSQEQLNHLTL